MNENELLRGELDAALRRERQAIDERDGYAAIVHRVNADAAPKATPSPGKVIVCGDAYTYEILGAEKSRTTVVHDDSGNAILELPGIASVETITAVIRIHRRAMSHGHDLGREECQVAFRRLLGIEVP